MSNVSASAVAELRARTGVSILACKQALEEANGDQELAIELLRKRGMAQAVKKADRDQAEGGFFVAATGTKAAAVQVKCETDFVARGDDFIALGQALADEFLKGGDAALKAKAEELVPGAVQKLGENISLGESTTVEATSVGTYVHSNRKIAVLIGLNAAGKETEAKDVAMHAAAMNPAYISPDEVTDEAVAKEKEIWKEQMKDDKKPAEILEKIMQGKEKKFREEQSLLKQPFAKDTSKSVEQYLSGAGVTTYIRMAI